MRKIRIAMTWAFTLISFSLFAQTKEVSGKVTDPSGAGIPSATIRIKGQKGGTSADPNGFFKLNTPLHAVLIISGVGYDPVEVSVADRSTVTISLKPNNSALSEVVVTALGIKREKKALGYAVATVDKSALELRPEGDIGRVLTGKAPGLNILSTSGLSGSGTNINIRGISTISGSSQPLFVVDGVPFDASTNTQSDFTFGHQTSSRFLDLDPNNIESVNVLKGLSATVLYGEAGRNGVILITTKNGASQKAKGKAEVTVSQSYFATKAILPEYNTKYGGGFDLSQGIAFFSNWGAAFKNPPVAVKHPYDKSSLANEFPQYKGAPYYYKYYNSVPRFFRMGGASNTGVNVSGAGQNASYSMSYSYLDDEGYIPGNSMYKNTFGFGGSARLANKLTVSGTINYVTTNVSSPPTSNSYGNNATNTSVFGNVLYTPTAVDLMGLPYELPSDHSSIYYRNGNDIQNPRWTLYNSFTVDRVSRTFGQMLFNYALIKGLSLSYRIGFDNYTEFQEYAQNKGGISTPTGIYRTNTGINNIWDHTLFLNFNRNFSDFSLNVDAGANAKRTHYEQTGMTSTQQLVYGLMNHGSFVNHSPNSEDLVTPLNYGQDFLSLGLFAQATLGYKDWAYLTAGGRNSTFSSVEQINRTIFYPSASLSFIPTSAIESWKESKVVNYLKLRVGYATSANPPTPYSTRSSLFVSTRNFLTSKGTAININAIPPQMANPNLKPELLKEIEGGIEGKFLENRVDVDLTLYRRVANDQILNQFLDPSSGFVSRQINVGKVTNKGIELKLGVVAVQSRDWKWYVEGLYTLNKSMVSGIPAELPQINTAGFSNEGTFAKNGHPLGIIMANYFQKDLKTGQKLVGTDGNYINSNDIGIIGDPNALYKLTGISTLTFKGFTFRMQWDFVEGGEMYSGTAGALLGRGVTRDTEFDRAAPYILPGVMENGQPNNIQISATQAYYTNSITNGAADESAIFDATCIRLREASLSYSLPGKVLDKTPFGSMSLSLSGTNLWYNAPNFPKYMHFDPEASGLGVGNGRGMEFLTGPSARRYGASLRITF